MEQEVSSFGDYRLDRAGCFIHDRLVSHGPDGISVRRPGGLRRLYHPVCRYSIILIDAQLFPLIVHFPD